MSNLNLKDLQNVCLEIFKEIKRICDKNNIKYYLDGGTMLGAIRHEGFIPWDDDLDVAMFRNEYNKFIEVAKKELDSKFFLQTTVTDKNYPLPFTKIRKNNTYINEPQYSEIDMHQGIFVDIFPVDVVPTNNFFRKLNIKNLRLKYIIACISNKQLKLSNNAKWTKIVKFIRHFFFINSKHYLGIFDRALQKFNKKKNPKYFASLTTIQSEKVVYKAEWFDSYVLKKFEDVEAYVPVGYDELLTHTYGNYMQFPPEEKRKPIHGLSFKIDCGSKNE